MFQTVSYGSGSRKLSMEDYFEKSNEDLDSTKDIVLRE